MSRGGRHALGVLAAAITLLAPAAAQGGTHLLVTDRDQDQTAVFDAATTGALSPVAGSPFAGGDEAAGVALTPDGRYAYVANAGAGNVTAYSVGTDGALAQLPGSPVASGIGPVGVAVSPDGRSLYVGDYAGTALYGFAIGANGALDPLPGSPYASPSPISVAISPNDKFLYTSGYISSDVTPYAIGSDGALTQIGSPVPAGFLTIGLSVTPDGDHLYAGSLATGQVFGFEIAADGTISDVPGSPFANTALPVGTAISPDGKYLHVTGDTDLETYAIAADGSITAVPGSPVSAPNVEAAAISPDGRFVYGSTISSGVQGFAVGSGGTLTELTGSPFGTTSSYVQSIAFQPNQGPTAAFTPDMFSAGVPVKFDASASSDPDGTIARYDWDFGDGTTLADGGPTPSHTYATAGSYDVSLTVTDDIGCSTSVVFTGQTASCNGTGAAKATHTISDVPPVITDLKVTPKRFAASGQDTPAKQRGAEIDLTLSEDADVRFRIRKDPQRRNGGPPPRRLRKFTRSLESGASSVPFTGTLGKRTFKSGRYVVIARAFDSADQRSERVSAKFRITAP